jgi:hypothetical protein
MMLHTLPEFLSQASLKLFAFVGMAVTYFGCGYMIAWFYGAVRGGDSETGGFHEKAAWAMFGLLVFNTLARRLPLWIPGWSRVVYYNDVGLKMVEAGTDVGVVIALVLPFLAWIWRTISHRLNTVNTSGGANL